MNQETVAMSASERERLILMDQVARGEMLLKEAAWQMGVSARQAVRIKKRYAASGALGLVHRGRGRASNHALPCALRQQAVAVYAERYAGFGPTLAAEKMREDQGLAVSRETLRRWLMAEGQWRCGALRRTHRRRRKRRERFGELLQIDGSEHAWFEQRAPRCTLMVLIDDATGRIALHMAAAETTRDALIVLRKWVQAHGVPAALYADRKTVYFTETYLYQPARRRQPETFTDFMKAAARLNIEMIPAYSPQAKGRVERMNGTLQDRLVKELRLRGIQTIEQANAMLDDFARQINRRFAREPAQPADAHRSPPRGKRQWDYFFCTERQRVVQRDNTVAYQNQLWQILPQPHAPRPGARLTLRIPLRGAPYWLSHEKRLATKYLGPRHRTPPPPADLSHPGSKIEARPGKKPTPRVRPSSSPANGARVASQRSPILQAGPKTLQKPQNPKQGTKP